MIIFIIIGAMVAQCTINAQPLLSYCAITDFKAFGALASMGLVELIFDYRGLVAIFQKKNEPDEEEKKEE